MISELKNMQDSNNKNNFLNLLFTEFRNEPRFYLSFLFPSI
jgi:hypothetical protein